MSYRKITDRFTTHCLIEPDYELSRDASGEVGGAEQEAQARITELCTIDGVTYAAIPAGVVLPPQPVELGVDEIELTEELRAAIRRESTHVQLINARVVERIRERYDVNEEIKMLRTGPTEETDAYNDYVEACRAWGREEKAKLGL